MPLAPRYSPAGLTQLEHRPKAVESSDPLALRRAPIRPSLIAWK
jgi:hypothetical protein